MVDILKVNFLAKRRPLSVPPSGPNPPFAVFACPRYLGGSLCNAFCHSSARGGFDLDKIIDFINKNEVGVVVTMTTQRLRCVRWMLVVKPSWTR